MNENKLIPIENQGQRVLTTAQLAESYETTTKVISNNFNRNKSRYAQGKHFYCLTGDEKREFCNRHQIEDGSKATDFYLWTEKGALLHAKSLNTDKAWEVYDFLVENYFNPVKKVPQMTPLEMIASIANNAVEMERKQKLIEAKQAEQEIAIADTNKRLDNMCDVISLDKNSWRKDAKSLIVKIAKKSGSGCDCINCVYDEIYKALESRAGVSLGIRLTNKRNRMFGEGISKSKINQLNKMDIIADDKKLIEIYVAIVKEMAVKYGVC